MAYVLGIAHAVPEQVIRNQDLTKFMETSDEWIVQRTGIKERHWARRGFSESGECTSLELAKRASLGALSNSKLDPSQIEAIIYATISPDFEIPGNGAALQRELFGTRAIPVFEIRNHCAGFIYALLIAKNYLDAGRYKNVLVIGLELQSTGLNLSNSGRDTAVLFGDGGGALVVSSEQASPSSIIDVQLESDGSFADKLGLAVPGFRNPIPVTVSDFEGEHPPASPHMEGRVVFKMASVKMPEMVKKIVSANGFSLEGLKLIIPHQANQRIIDMLGVELDCATKVFSNISRYGNTTAGSIPLALSEAVQSGLVERGDLICLVSFGAGFSWGAALLRW